MLDTTTEGRIDTARDSLVGKVHDPDERESPDAADQIREVLSHGNYLSQRDIEIRLGFDAESRTER